MKDCLSALNHSRIIVTHYCVVEDENLLKRSMHTGDTISEYFRENMFPQYI